MIQVAFLNTAKNVEIMNIHNILFNFNNLIY